MECFDHFSNYVSIIVINDLAIFVSLDLARKKINSSEPCMPTNKQNKIMITKLRGNY